VIQESMSLKYEPESCSLETDRGLFLNELLMVVSRIRTGLLTLPANALHKGTAAE